MFPRTTVGGLSLSRMIIGTNWILGYSHKSAADDELIRLRNNNREATAEIIEIFLEQGVDTIMAPIAGNQALVEGIQLAEQRTGKRVYRVDTPIVNVSDSKDDRAAALATIKSCKDVGADFCLLHHSSCEQLVNKNTRTINRLPDYTSMIRDCGMIPGLSAHMPEIIVYSDENEYDVETYIQIYNSLGFLMQIEVESVHRIIHNAKKPVMTIKSMAAGRQTPFVGLNFSFNTLRECDMVTVGCLTPAEAREDIEIGLAAIERRRPNLSGRSSPNKNTAVLEEKK